MALTDTSVRNLKPSEKPAKYSDGGGLHLLVNPGGSKLWRLAYRYSGRQKLLAFGAYPAVSLSDARRKRGAAKALLALGIDPGVQAKQDKLKKRTSDALTFKIVAADCLGKMERDGKAASTRGKAAWLLDLAGADLGDRPIGELTASEVLVCLKKVEAKGNYETALRMRATIGRVFRHAIANGQCQNDPTTGLRGALATPVVQHRAALTTAPKFAELLRAVWAYGGNPETRIALQLMAILYPRPGELRQAEWTEFDLDKAVWLIPGSRTKMRREHRKPLPAIAIALLRELELLTGDGRFAFPAIHDRKRTMSENTLNQALRRMGFKAEEATAHGFRASASSLLNESGKWSPDAIEAELAHVDPNAIRKAYHRAQYWQERMEMAEWWGGEINRLILSPSGNAHAIPTADYRAILGDPIQGSSHGKNIEPGS